MMRIVSVAGFLLLSMVTVTASAGEVEAVTALKADIEEVRTLGKVVPVDGVTSAGQPDEEAFRVFADSGYTTVIDIRTEGEDRGLDEPAVVEKLGMKYVLLPVGRSDINVEKARELDALIKAEDGPVLVHCGSANRVGALFALSLFDRTGDAEAALATGKEAGLTGLEDRVREVIQMQTEGQD